MTGRRRYVELAELAVLEQIAEDSERLDRESLAVGPFARLDANALAARDGKTRGAVTNLFGSQAALQAETMALALDAAQLMVEEHRQWVAPTTRPTRPSRSHRTAAVRAAAVARRDGTGARAPDPRPNAMSLQ